MEKIQDSTYVFTDKADNVKESIIERTSTRKNTFTMVEVEKHMEILRKQRKEIEAMVELQGAKMINIETNHPFVKEMSEEDLFTAHMYQEAKALKSVSENKVDEINSTLSDYESEIIDIQSQLPELKPEHADGN